MSLNRRRFLQTITASAAGMVAAAHGVAVSSIRHSPLPDPSLPLALELVEELWCEHDITGISDLPQRFTRIREYYNVVNGKPVFTRTDWIEPSGKVVTIPISNKPQPAFGGGGLC